MDRKSKTKLIMIHVRFNKVLRWLLWPNTTLSFYSGLGTALAKFQNQIKQCLKI